jgi:hypothetical protein
MDNWIPLMLELPDESETVWLYNVDSKFLALGCRIVEGDDWLWAVSNGVIYAEGGKIVSECEPDDYEFTHFCRLPELPV